MEKLINFIENQVKWAKKYPEHAEAYYRNAFGAVQFYDFEHDLRGTESAELETLWNETYKPSFEAIMYGGDAV